MRLYLFSSRLLLSYMHAYTSRVNVMTTTNINDDDDRGCWWKQQWTTMKTLVMAATNNHVRIVLKSVKCLSLTETKKKMKTFQVVLYRSFVILRFLPLPLIFMHKISASNVYYWIQIQIKTITITKIRRRKKWSLKHKISCRFQHCFATIFEFFTFQQLQLQPFLDEFVIRTVCWTYCSICYTPPHLLFETFLNK